MLKGPTDKIILFGSSGEIGSFLKNALTKSSCQVSCFAWTDLQPFLHIERQQVDTKTKDYIESKVGPIEKHTFIFANGLTNPSIQESHLLFSNFEFPSQIISIFGPNSLARFITIGTIFENFPQSCETNAYLKSKLLLGSHIHELGRTETYRNRMLHIRLHTIYGGKPKPYMFLGQVIDSIKHDRPLKMSSGHQLREYHHVQDISKSLYQVLMRGVWSFGPLLEINSGQPVQLRRLAQHVFDYFDKNHLLEIGGIDQTQIENEHLVFDRSPEWLLLQSRNPISGIIDWIRQLVN